MLNRTTLHSSLTLPHPKHFPLAAPPARYNPTSLLLLLISEELIGSGSLKTHLTFAAYGSARSAEHSLRVAAASKQRI